MNTNRLNIKEIQIGKEYYSVMCGKVYKIKFLHITEPKASIQNLDYDFIEDYYLSDVGVEYECESYVNSLNKVFSTAEEAYSFCNSDEYRGRLRFHNEECDRWDSIDF